MWIKMGRIDTQAHRHLNTLISLKLTAYRVLIKHFDLF
jgi:hypothetical protein